MTFTSQQDKEEHNKLEHKEHRGPSGVIWTYHIILYSYTYPQNLLNKREQFCLQWSLKVTITTSTSELALDFTLFP